MPISVSEYRKLKGIREHLELENQFQDQVVHLAKLYGWGWPNPDDPKKYEGIYHNPDSRKDNAGLPDLIMFHPTQCRLLIVELKRTGQRTKGLSDAQWRVWEILDSILNKLCQAELTGYIDFRIWTPEDLDSGEILRVLKGAA